MMFFYSVCMKMTSHLYWTVSYLSFNFAHQEEFSKFRKCHCMQLDWLWDDHIFCCNVQTKGNISWKRNCVTEQSVVYRLNLNTLQTDLPLTLNATNGKSSIRKKYSVHHKLKHGHDRCKAGISANTHLCKRQALLWNKPPPPTITVSPI